MSFCEWTFMQDGKLYEDFSGNNGDYLLVFIKLNFPDWINYDNTRNRYSTKVIYQSEIDEIKSKIHDKIKEVSFETILDVVNYGFEALCCDVMMIEKFVKEYGWVQIYWRS